MHLIKGQAEEAATIELRCKCNLRPANGGNKILAVKAVFTDKNRCTELRKLFTKINNIYKTKPYNSQLPFPK